MIDDLSPDVKKFLLTYASIDQLTRLAKDELNRINESLEVELAKQPWFSSTEFQTATSWQWVQVWNKRWQPSVTQNCPWIHFEYTFSWSHKWAQISVDLESQKIASWDSIQSVAEHLRQSLSKDGPEFLKGQGWLLRPALEGRRMVLLKRQTIDDAKFSAEWIFNTGTTLFEQLSELIPYVDSTIKELFSEQRK
jgi:hypothetical protein